MSTYTHTIAELRASLECDELDDEARAHVEAGIDTFIDIDVEEAATESFHQASAEAARLKAELCADVEREARIATADRYT